MNGGDKNKEEIPVTKIWPHICYLGWNLAIVLQKFVWTDDDELWGEDSQELNSCKIPAEGDCRRFLEKNEVEDKPGVNNLKMSD